jgi:hypothetical protein
MAVLCGLLSIMDAYHRAIDCVLRCVPSKGRCTSPDRWVVDGICPSTARKNKGFLPNVAHLMVTVVPVITCGMSSALVWCGSAGPFLLLLLHGYIIVTSNARPANAFIVMNLRITRFHHVVYNLLSHAGIAVGRSMSLDPGPCFPELQCSAFH